MRTIIALALLSLAPTALAGDPVAAKISTYEIIAVRPIGETKALKAGESAQVEVVSTSKLASLGLTDVKVGDKVTLTCVKEGSMYSVSNGRLTVKFTVEGDGSVKVAR